MTATVTAGAPLAVLAAGGKPTTWSETPATAPDISRAVLAPRSGGDATADWYPAAVLQLARIGVRTEIVPSLPEPTAPSIDATAASIANAVGDNPHEIAETILIGHSVGSLALLAHLTR